MTTFDDFRVGDYAIFDRSFSRADFAAFSKLSGDANPLHGDPSYAARHAADGVPILPLHLTLMPLSMIAGMIFPGEPSLYLGHEVNAIRAAKYDELLRYSARIVSINRSHRILSLRVLALQHAAVVLDATLRVQARSEQWPSGRSELVRQAGVGQAFITGASGEIGSAIALALAKAGWGLLLQDRGSEPRREQLRQRIVATGAEARFVAADLGKPVQLETVLKAVGALDDLDLVVHAASPDVTAPIAELVAVNFSAFKRIADVAVPKLLARQRGAIVFLGSTAVRAALPGWEAYSGAKAMTMNLVDAIDRRSAPYGVRSYTLAPGYVATRFSEPYRTKSDAALLPAEVAEALIELIGDRDRPGNTQLLEPGRVVRGQFGFQARASERELASADEAALAAPAAAPPPAPAQVRDDIAPLVRSVLKLPAGGAVAGGGLGLTPGWDSLKHVEIILSIEAHYGVHFKSSEIEATHRYDDLVALCTRKMQAGKTR